MHMVNHMLEKKIEDT